jgi:hypothetical protein
MGPFGIPAAAFILDATGIFASAESKRSHALPRRASGTTHRANRL